MSNYQVEPVHKPQALTEQAIKSMRQHQVEGLSRRQLLRGSLGAGIGLWLLEVTAGTIGFIGLVAPHLVRPFVRYDPGRLLVPAALSGAALLLSADIAVRLIPSVTEIKVGVLTALIGAPFFIALILRRRHDLSGVAA